MLSSFRRRTIAWCTLSIAVAIPYGAGAQSPPSSAAAAPNPQQTPHAEPTQAPTIGVFGDFGGARSALARRGVTFRGHIVSEFAANPIGGLQQGDALASEVQVGADVNVGVLANDGLGTLHATFTARTGSSLSGNAIGNILTVQEIYGSGLTPRLTEFSYEQPLANKALNLSLGRVITENDFAASPTYWGANLYCLYQSNAICGTPIAAPIDSGYDAYPQSTWGARLRATLSPNVQLLAGAYQVNPTYGLRGQGFNLGFGGTTGTYLPFEARFQTLDTQQNATGNLRLGGYYDTSTATYAQNQISRFATPGSSPLFVAAPTIYSRGRYGYWAQLDHVIVGGAGPGARGTAAFLSYEWGDPQTALIHDFIDAGIVQHGTFHGRDADTIALGYAYANVNPNIRTYEASLLARGLGVPYNTQEQIAELNYGLQVKPWVTLRPGLQYVWRPSGNAAIPGAFVLDLSTAITF